MVLRPGGPTSVLAFGAPWILFDHNPSFDLYNIATRKWRALGCDSPRCMPDGTMGYALGARWLEFIVQGQQSCGDGIHFECGPDTYAFYNLRTHRARRGSPQTSTRIVDLGSPTLVRKLCPPLRVPAGGSVELEGRVGVITDAHGSFLERCGSRQHMPVDAPPPDVPPGSLFVSSRAVLWPVLDQLGAWTGRIGGVSLPSLRRFTGTLPRSFNQSGGNVHRRPRHEPPLRRERERRALGGDALNLLSR